MGFRNQTRPDSFIQPRHWVFSAKVMALALVLWVGLLICGQSAAAQAQSSGAVTYQEPYRPQFHFTPQKNWMNDPNGLVYYDGEYHLFYQYNPFGNKWGHMSWGHAVSRDLVHWQHLPVALAEENGVMIFSGSAVVDTKNTSGFGKNGRPAMVAIYTGYRPDSHLQTQNIAYSTDRGRTWTKYSGNPVIDIHSTDFRDPKVFWHEPTHRWIMTVALSGQHKVRFYGSPDLKQWAPLSDFGPAGATGGDWECPDLFELPVVGKPGLKKWALIVNINPGGIAGGSGAQYFTGSFDGTHFSLEDQGRWLDYGKDYYAVVTWSNVPPKDGRRLSIGWINNWEYGQEIPTSPWRSMQSVPRELRLKAYSDGLYLVQSPVVELQQLRDMHYKFASQTIAEGSDPLAGKPIKGKTLEIIATFEPGTASEFGLKLRKGANEETVVGYDTAAAQLFLDRSRSGKVDFNPKFTGRRSGPLPAEQGRVTLHLFLDWSTVEVLGNDGRIALTEQIFPGPDSDDVALYARGGAAKLVSLEAWELRSIWNNAGAKPASRR
jgi:fructan beta-fructosidase